MKPSTSFVTATTVLAVAQQALAAPLPVAEAAVVARDAAPVPVPESVSVLTARNPEAHLDQ